MFVCVCRKAPNPGDGEVRGQLGDLNHLRPVGELLKDPQAQRKLLLRVRVGLALLQLETKRRRERERDRKNGEKES